MFCVKNCRLLLGLRFVLCPVLVTMTGCAKDESAANSPSPAPGGSPPAATAATGTMASTPGKAIFDANGCARCHALNGAGGQMGPDLTHAGAAATHTPQWLMDHVKNPKQHNPGSRMPSYANKISDADLKTLGDYLAGLK